MLGDLVRPNSSRIQKFVLANVSAHPRDIARVTAAQFSISRQATNVHLRALVSEGMLSAAGARNGLAYSLVPLVEESLSLRLQPKPDEDVVWRDFVKDKLADLPTGVRDICSYGFSEILNNAIDHAEGYDAVVTVYRDGSRVRLSVVDDGVGIFRKISQKLGCFCPET